MHSCRGELRVGAKHEVTTVGGDIILRIEPLDVVV